MYRFLVFGLYPERPDFHSIVVPTVGTAKVKTTDVHKKPNTDIIRLETKISVYGRGEDITLETDGDRILLWTLL